MDKKLVMSSALLEEEEKTEIQIEFGDLLVKPHRFFFITVKIVTLCYANFMYVLLYYQ